jgi:hypothetical protein
MKEAIEKLAGGETGLEEEKSLVYCLDLKGR